MVHKGGKGQTATSVVDLQLCRSPLTGTARPAGPQERHDRFSTVVERAILNLDNVVLVVRKGALAALLEALAVPSDLEREHVQVLLERSYKALFKVLADPSEACRDLGLRVTAALFRQAHDTSPVLAHLFPVRRAEPGQQQLGDPWLAFVAPFCTRHPHIHSFVPCTHTQALRARLSSSAYYDTDSQLFVHDAQAHEAYQRGKATVVRQVRTRCLVCRVVLLLISRCSTMGHMSTQDKAAHVQLLLETSEDVRLQLCQLLHLLVQLGLERNSERALRPYFHDLVLALHAQLHDPFPVRP